MNEAWEVDFWTRELGVSKDELQTVANKVGNSTAAVRRELGQSGLLVRGRARAMPAVFGAEPRAHQGEPPSIASPQVFVSESWNVLSFPTVASRNVRLSG